MNFKRIGRADEQVRWMMLGLSDGQDWLSISSNLAQTVTGIVAGVAGVRFICQRRQRRLRLERYLEEKRRESDQLGNKESGVKSIAHLMGNCLMTEAQILEAAFASEKISTWMTVGEDGYAGKLMFQLSEDAWHKAKKAN